MAKIKNCEWCGTEFEDKRVDGTRFCGKPCATRHRNSLLGNPTSGMYGNLNPNWRGGNLRHCGECGGTFLDKHYDGKKFCSKSCSAKHNNRLRSPKTKPIVEKKRKIKQVKPLPPKPIKLPKASKPPRPPKPPKTPRGKIAQKAARLPDPVKRPKPARPMLTCATCSLLFASKNRNAKFCSRKCYHNSADFAEKQGRRNRGKTIPEWHRQAVSKAQSSISDESRFTYGRSGRHSSPKAGNILYRSSYEQLAYQILDNDATVTHYMPEPFAIEYTNQDGNTRRYRPDILVGKEGQTILVEVKPQWKLSDPTTQLKIEAGERYAAQKGWVFEVWTEKELGI